MKDFDFYDKNYMILSDLAKMTSSFSRGVSKIVQKQKEELDENDFKRLYRQIDNLKGPFVENEQVYNKFLEENSVKIDYCINSNAEKIPLSDI